MAANRYRLVIGNKNWSSWSLRPWLAMRRLGLPFEEINVRLRLPESKAEISQVQPVGPGAAAARWGPGDLGQPRHPRVSGGASTPTRACGPPTGRRARWRAASRPRCIPALPPCAAPARWSSWRRTRSTRSRRRSRPTSAASSPFGGECRARFGDGGPFLFGAFSAADAMYAPVASRFRTYVPDLSRLRRRRHGGRLRRRRSSRCRRWPTGPTGARAEVAAAS